MTKARSPRARGDLAVAVATLAGIGFVPFAPGTAASLATLVSSVPWSENIRVLLAVLILSLPLAVWAGGNAARRLGKRDPAPVVIDEAAGMLFVLAYVGGSGWRELAAGFVLFRLFDIVKPFPLRALEKLPGGIGILADDIGAALYTILLLAASRRI